MAPDKQTALKKALLDGLRTVVFAAISAALTAGISYVGSVQDPTIQLVLFTVLTAAQKAWDRYIHLSPATSQTGLLPF